MRRVLIAAGAASLGVLVASGTASADPLDLTLGRLTFYNSTPNAPEPTYTYGAGCGTADTNFAQCEPDNQLFVNLINQLGGALAPSLLAPAGTIGYNGLYFAYEHSISNINSQTGNRAESDNPWLRGVQGTNFRGPGSTLFVSRFHVRKGFPFGFELGLQTSWLHESSNVAMGLDIRWALFEGFRRGVGYLPEFAVRGSVNTLLGNPQLYMTVVGVDASLSWQISVTGMFTLTPYLGGQALFIFGDSTVIDATPTRSGFQECTRRRTVFSRDAEGNERSELICEAGSQAPMMGPNDSRNEVVFMPTRILRGRGFAGLRFRVGILTITGEFAMDAIGPSYLNPNNTNGQGRPNAMTGERGRPEFESFRQWMTSFGVGATF